MVRLVVGLIVRDDRDYYDLVCGHAVLAHDYSRLRGVWKDRAWCPTCWIAEQGKPC